MSSNEVEKMEMETEEETPGNRQSFKENNSITHLFTTS